MTKVANTAIVGELKRLARINDGILKPLDVVEAARPKSSPLHSRFEWDDTVAGHNYRIWQAQQLIRVTVEVMERTGEREDVFVSLSRDRQNDGGGYRVVAQVMTQKELREEMLADALRELESFQRKYRHLQELAGVFTAVKKVKH